MSVIVVSIALMLFIGVGVVIQRRGRRATIIPVQSYEDVLCNMISLRQQVDPALKGRLPPKDWPMFQLWATPEAAILAEVEKQLWRLDGSGELALVSTDELSLRSALLPSAKRALTNEPGYLALGEDLLREAIEHAFHWTTGQIAETREPGFGLASEHWGTQISVEDALAQYSSLKDKNDRCGHDWRSILNRRVDSDEIWTFDLGAHAGVLLARRGREIARVTLVRRCGGPTIAGQRRTRRAYAW